MAWFNALKISVTNGSNVAQVVSGESVANIRPGDGLIIGSFNPVEINRPYATSQGQYIELLKPWSNATQSQVPGLAMPTSGDFNSAVIALKDANTMVNDNVRAMVDWQTKLGSVQFTDLDGNVQTVKTLRQMQSELDNVNPYPAAMTKAAFDMICQDRQRLYAGSGFVTMGRHPGGNTPTINDGMYIHESNASYNTYLNIGREIDGIGPSDTEAATLLINGVVHTLRGLPTQNRANYELFSIRLPDPPDGTETFDSSSGVLIKHASPEIAFASETSTATVIGTRQDFIFIEQFHEAISTTGEIFPYGNVHYQHSNWAGIELSKSSTPQSYFALGTWDTETDAYSAKISELTASQLDQILQDSSNNIYHDAANDELVQVRYRVHVIRGNSGRWDTLYGAGGMPVWGYCGGVSWITAQGQQASLSNSVFVKSQHDDATLADSDSVAVEGEQNTVGVLSYGQTKPIAVPVALVQRLSASAYHPVYSPFGADKCARLNGAASDWHDTDNPIVSKSDAYTKRASGTSQASGLHAGQVIDLRLNAHWTDLEKLRSDTISKFINGAARGIQRPLWLHTKHEGQLVQFIKAGDAVYEHANDTVSLTVERTSDIKFFLGLSTCYWLLQGNNGATMKVARVNSEVDYLYTGFGSKAYLYGSGDVAREFNAKFPDGTEITVMAQSYCFPEFDRVPCVDIVGNMTDIARTFPDGVCGSWIPVSPRGDGQLQYFSANYKAVTLPKRCYTLNHGITWASSAESIDGVTNEVKHSTTNVVGLVSLWFYETVANLTVSSIQHPLCGQPGNVYVSSTHSVGLGNKLNQSLLGQPTTDNHPANVYAKHICLNSYSIDPTQR
ncbi:hypothetical protein, partial [Pseudoalteromonas rubra]|uniref:hypothetical protein n=1 Tax=Pseudoalteromonas rubra TaxID=43658 RepID=UPI002DB7EB3D